MRNRNPRLWEPHQWTTGIFAQDVYGNSKNPKGMMMAVFAMSSGWTGIWWYAFTKSVMEKTPASKLLCKVGNVLSRILVGDGHNIQSTIVATGSPAILFLVDEVEGRSPGAMWTPNGAVSEHLLELVFRDLEAVWCQLPWAQSYKWSRCGANVMDCRKPGSQGIPEGQIISWKS